MCRYGTVLGLGKQGALSVYRLHSRLLNGFGCFPLLDSLERAENFLCLLYKTEKTRCDEARLALFGKVSGPELLPPTSEAAKLHILRALYQVAIWRNAHIADPILPDPTEYGWKLEDDQLKPNFGTLPIIPVSCKTLLSCGCKSGCKTRLCKCRRTSDVCTQLCKCAGDCQNQNEIESDDDF